jgi:hypothetical protein
MQPQIPGKLTSRLDRFSGRSSIEKTMERDAPSEKRMVANPTATEFASMLSEHKAALTALLNETPDAVGSEERCSKAYDALAPRERSSRLAPHHAGPARTRERGSRPWSASSPWSSKKRGMLG